MVNAMLVQLLQFTINPRPYRLLQQRPVWMGICIIPYHLEYNAEASFFRHYFSLLVPNRRRCQDRYPRKIRMQMASLVRRNVLLCPSRSRTSPFSIMI